LVNLSEPLEKYGERGVAACFSRAKPFPVKGLYKLSEFPDAGSIQTYSTGFSALDSSSDRTAPYMQLYEGRQSGTSWPLLAVTPPAWCSVPHASRLRRRTTADNRVSPMTGPDHSL